MNLPRTLWLVCAVAVLSLIMVACGGPAGSTQITQRQPPPPPTGTNYTTCANQAVPNWQYQPFISNYKPAIAALVQHVSQASYAGQIGYIRIGLGKGGEINLPQGWDQSSSGACYGGYFTAWKYAAGSPSDNWNVYLQNMVLYEQTLGSNIPLLVSITPITDIGIEPDDFIAPIAVNGGMSFGNQGLEASDITNFESDQPCGGDWCNLFAQYPPTSSSPIRELQTIGQSCPSGLNNCPDGNTQTNSTGSLASTTPPTLLSFATSNGANDLELYYQDWLVAFENGYNDPVDPNSANYESAYASAITAAADLGTKMQILFPPTSSGASDFPGVQAVITNNPGIVTGVVLDVNWSDFDLGNSGASGNYNWAITDAEIELYTAISPQLKVNLVLQNTTYGGSGNCPSSGPGSNGNEPSNCAMPTWMWTVLQ